MKYPYLRTTDCLKRDCTHCASFLSFQRESHDPKDEKWKKIANIEDQVLTVGEEPEPSFIHTIQDLVRFW